MNWTSVIFLERREIVIGMSVMNFYLWFFVILDDKNIYYEFYFICDNCSTFPPNCPFSKDTIQYLQRGVSFRSADCCSRWEMDYVEEEGGRVRMERRVDQYYSYHLAVLNIQQWHSTRFNEILSKHQNTDWLTDSSSRLAFRTHNIWYI